MAVYGISEAGVQHIKDAISDYRSALYNNNFISVSGSPLNNALKGSNTQDQVNKMALKCQSELDNLSRLFRDTFQTEMETVLSNYKSQDSSTNVVANATQNIKS